MLYIDLCCYFVMYRYEILSSCVSELVDKGLLYLPTTSQDHTSNDDIAITMLYNAHQGHARGERNNSVEEDDVYKSDDHAGEGEELTLAVIAREYTEGKPNYDPLLTSPPYTIPVRAHLAMYML